MWLHNNLNLTTVNAYNEKEPVRDTGGITIKEDYDTIELKILIVPIIKRFRQGEKGRFEEQLINFQVSKSELTKKSFDMLVGKSHIIHGGIDHKVMNVQDFSWDPGLQLYRCVAKRMMPVGNLI